VNRKRKAVILIAAALLTLSGLFPNWVERDVRGVGYIEYNPLGRAFLLKGPTEQYSTRELPATFDLPVLPELPERIYTRTPKTEAKPSDGFYFSSMFLDDPEYLRQAAWREEQLEKIKITVWHTRRLPGFIDYKRMFLEWAVILIPSIGLWCAFSGSSQPKPRKPKPVKASKEDTIADYEDWKDTHDPP